MRGKPKVNKREVAKRQRAISKKEIELLLQKGAQEASITRDAIKGMSIMGADVRGMVFRACGKVTNGK